MNVIVKNLKIKNFRSCIETNVYVNPYTALVGYNNAGKSNIILAIKFLLEPSSTKNFPMETNCYDKNEPFEVECELHNIDDEYLSLIDEIHVNKVKPFIKDGILKVKKISFLDAKDKQKIQVQLFDGITWEKNPAGIENSIIELFPSIIHISAMSDSVEDSTKAKTTTSIGKLLALISEEIMAEYQSTFESSLSNLRDLIEYDGSSRIPALSDIDTGINTILNQIFPDVSVKLHFTTPNIADILKDGTLKIFENEITSRELNNFGHGTQRSIQMALIRYLAQVKKGSTAKRKTTVICIDEPELYLHPSTIHLIKESLISLSKSGYQILFSTHSPALLSAENAMDAIQIYKNVDGTQARETITNLLSKYERTHAAQLQDIFKLNNSSQIFFSEKILLVEGKTETRIISLTYEKMKNKNFHFSKIAIVPVDSKTSLIKMAQVLTSLGFSSKILTDLDYIGYCKKAELVDDGNQKLFDDFRLTVEKIHVEGKIDVEPNHYKCLKSLNSLSAEKYKDIQLNVEIHPYIDAIHENLKGKDIFLWKEGDIEEIFGFKEKKEKQWQQFRKELILEGKEIRDIVKHYNSLSEMIEWLDA